MTIKYISLLFLTVEDTNKKNHFLRKCFKCPMQLWVFTTLCMHSKPSICLVLYLYHVVLLLYSNNLVCVFLSYLTQDPDNVIFVMDATIGQACESQVNNLLIDFLYLQALGIFSHIFVGCIFSLPFQLVLLQSMVFFFFTF